MEVRGMFISLINKVGFLMFCQLMANIPSVVVFVLIVRLLPSLVDPSENLKNNFVQLSTGK